MLGGSLSYSAWRQERDGDPQRRGLLLHKKPTIALPNPASLHHKSSARGIVSGSARERWGRQKKKGRERGGIRWHAWNWLAQPIVSPAGSVQLSVTASKAKTTASL